MLMLTFKAKIQTMRNDKDKAPVFSARRNF